MINFREGFSRSVLLFFCLSFHTVLFAAEPVYKQFIKFPKYVSAEISPDGEKLAVIVLEEGKRVLALMSLDPLKFTYVLRFTQDEQVGEVSWVNDERVLVAVWRQVGWFDSPVNQGKMYAINYDGRRSRMVFGWFDKGQQITGRLKKQEQQFAHATLIEELLDDKQHVLISTHPWTNMLRGRYEWRGDQIGDVLKLNVYNGRTRKLMAHPARGGRAYANRQGQVVFATGEDDAANTTLFQRVEGEWKKIATPGHRYSIPVGFSDDGEYAYLLSDENADTIGLERFHLKTGKREVVFRDERVDVSGVAHYPGSEEPMGTRIENGKPEYHFLDPKHSYARFFRGILKAFEGQRVSLESVTPDGRLAVIRTSADKLPSDFFLANLETKGVKFLLSSADWLDPDALARSEVIELKARDGTALQAYLTFPRTARSNLPMIVLPHGGPAARDYWGFYSEAQMLAANGYLVLQVNFRGSSGYGKSFRYASDREWGLSVQDDISDATRWVVTQGYADPERICIYGASFGGYSAMMSAIREPELYRCAAGYAGVYDLKLLYTEGDIKNTLAGQAYLKDVVGEERMELRAQSPVALASRLRVPIFIAHGGEDIRAPIEHAEALIKAAKDNKLDYTTHINDTGGHGFYTEAANEALYSDLLLFLAKHLKQ